MSRLDIVIALGRAVLVCVLATAGNGFDAVRGASELSGAAGGIQPYRLPLFYVAVGASTLAVLLAEHDRRANARTRE